MSSNIRSFLRKIKNKKKETKKNEYRPVDGNPTGSYIYTDHKTLTGCHEKEQKNEFWKWYFVEVCSNCRTCLSWSRYSSRWKKRG